MATKKQPTGASVAPKQPSPPVRYTRDVVLTVCERLSNGESMRAISLGDDMPSTTSWYRWCAGTDIDKTESAWLRDQYARARELQADCYAAKALEVAMTPMPGETTKTVVDGEDLKVETTSGDNVPRARLAYDALRWHASKLAPKKYGDKIEHSGPGDGGALIVEITRFGSKTE